MHLRTVFVKMPSETDAARFQTAFLSGCLYPPNSPASALTRSPTNPFQAVSAESCVQICFTSSP
ncbi:hypothetical protein NEICINOT_05080 [Neisseria cinerea ATCC 14685]|uniref:Uncharacterized protein n=1 Tax=Neisseria cinerea ATCC 14685 TaxID=546262 RepID=D0W5V9_NEICI|nr:hypothetical protein NEICINOT_05080 [Neisseria cinerea ATCC 14685]